MLQARLLQQSSARTVSLLQLTLFKEQKDSLIIEAKDQSEVVYISVIKGFCITTVFNNYEILYMLRKTELTV